VTHSDGRAVVRRRKVGASLRRLREEAGLTEQEAAAQLDCQLPRFRQIEAGMAAIRLAEVRGLLDFYDVAGEQRDEILGEARRARDRCWWYKYADLIDESFETQLILEDDAPVLRTYQPNLVPGLLQTERYACELIETQSDLPLETVRRLASLRVLRQQVLSRDDAPRFDVVLDEAVLRRPVGGPVVMRGQYGYLAEIAARPCVTIQVLPFEAGPHDALGAGFHIFEFKDGWPAVVELELLDRVAYVVEAGEVGRYTEIFEEVRTQALDAEESRALLTDLAARAGGAP
jgi:transcriptional regulator with XRE-family HTH domain